MKRDTKREISRTVPSDIPKNKPPDTTAILIAYDCVLMERFTGKGFVYYIVNIQTGKEETIARKTFGVTPSGIDSLVEKIRNSEIAGPGMFEAERPAGNGITPEKCKKILILILNEILPFYGYSINKEQISIAVHILDAICRRIISLTEIEEGAENIFLYLIPAILAKVGRINDHCVLSFYAEGRYLDNINMPILIATSSSSQQKALVNDFIPELSRILMDAEIIKQPITVVLRKGREHYVCENRLRNYVLNENKQNVKNALDSLLKPSTRIDLTKVDGLSKYAKQRVSAPDRCGLRCKYKDTCSYQFFRKEVKSYEIDIQVCDHNYLIADAIHRNELQPPLLPNYQMCIITEAHNFHKAARLMYGVELSSVSLPYLKKCIDRLGIKHELAEKQINKLSKKLATVSRNLFRHLINQTNDNDDCDVRDDNQIAATIDCNIARYLCSIHELSYKISDLLTFVPVAGNADDLKINVLFELKQILKQVTEFMNQNEVTCNIEKDHNEVRMCGTPKNLAARLYKEMWCKGIPTILLSGTLSVNGDFTKTKKSLGLDKVGSYRMTEKAGIQS